MLKYEKIAVWVEGAYQVEEVELLEGSKLQDKIRAEHEHKGTAETMFHIARDFFVLRLVAWKLEDDCTEANKQVFYDQFPGKANEILKDAEAQIKEIKDDRLKNLQPGADGT